MKKGFTLIEILAVIVILSITVTIVIVKVDSNIKDTTKFSNERLAETLEDAAILFVENYKNELTNFSSKKVDLISISQLIDKDLIDSKVIKEKLTNVVLVADVNGVVKSKYIKTSKPVIFLNGPSQISLKKGETYTEYGAYVAIPETEVKVLENYYISSNNIPTNTVGKYEKSYTYTSATKVIREIYVIE